MSRSNEIRQAERFLKSIDTMSDFNAALFAFGITTGAPYVIQCRVMDIFLECVKSWAVDYDGHFLNDDNINLLAKAKRIQDTIDRYK